MIEEKRITKLIEKIKQKKELSSIDDGFVQNHIFSYLKKNPGALNFLCKPRSKEYKQIVKDIRSVLRRLYGLFRSEERARVRHKLVDDLTSRQRISKPLLRRILETHASTKERLLQYEELYENIWNVTRKPKKILDLGAGINPFSIPFMGLKDLEYYAYDLSESEVESLQKFFAHLNKRNSSFKGHAGILDVSALAQIQELKKVDVCFLFKMTDVLDRGKGHKATEEVVTQVPAQFVVLSFATRTMSGRKMRAPKRRWVEWMCRRLEYEHSVFELGDEIFYVIKSKGWCKMNKTVKKELDKSLKWLAAEHGVLQELIEDIKQLLKDSQNALEQQEHSDLQKDLRKAFHDFRNVARAQRRATKYQKALQEDLREILQGAMQQSKFKRRYERFTRGYSSEADINFFSKYIDQLNVLVQQNIYLASRVDGQIQERLKDIEVRFAAGEFPENKIQEALEMAKKLDEWLAALVVDSQKAGKIALQLIAEHLPELDIQIKRSRTLPKLDYTHKFGKYKARIVINFDRRYNAHFDETAWVLESCQKFLHTILEPAQLELLEKKSRLYYNVPFLRSRMKDKTFSDAKKFNQYALEELLKVVCQILENNTEVMVMPSMTFIITIYGVEYRGVDMEFNASASPSYGVNVKRIHLGSLRLFLDAIFAEHFFTPTDLLFIQSILPFLEEWPGGKPLNFSRPESYLQENISGSHLTGVSYRQFSVASLVLHELTHTIDPLADNQMYYSNVRMISGIFPDILKRMYDNSYVVPKEFIRSLSLLFTRAPVEAVAMLSEFFLLSSKRKLAQRGFLVSTPLRVATNKVLTYFTNVMNRLEKRSLEQLELSLKNPASALAKGQSPQEPQGVHEYTYDMGHAMAMIIVIDSVFRLNIPTIIVSGEALMQAKEKFPVSMYYLTNHYVGTRRHPNLAQGSEDEALFEAYKKGDMNKVRKVLLNADVPLITTPKEFRRAYKRNNTFYIYRFDKRFALQILTKMKLSQLNFYTLYEDSCRRLGIPSMLGERRMGQVFYRSIKEYNQFFNKKMLG